VETPASARSDRLHKAIVRHEFDVVAPWSVDRLGLSLQDLVSFLGEVQGAGVDLYLDGQGVDSRTPAGKALFQMLGVLPSSSAASSRNAFGLELPERARRVREAASRSLGLGYLPRKRQRYALCWRWVARLAGVGKETVSWKRRELVEERAV